MIGFVIELVTESAVECTAEPAADSLVGLVVRLVIVGQAQEKVVETFEKKAVVAFVGKIELELEDWKLRE